MKLNFFGWNLKEEKVLQVLLVGGFSPTHLKNMLVVKLDHFTPIFGVKIKKNQFETTTYFQVRLSHEHLPS